MKQAQKVDRYMKIILTLIAVLLVALLCKPLFVANPVVASYETTADDAWYHADEAYYLAEEALDKAKEAYSHADSAYYRAEEVYYETEQNYSWLSMDIDEAKSRADEAYEKAEEACDKARVAEDNAYYYENRAENSAYQRMKRELSDLEEAFEIIAFFLHNNREDLIIIGEELGVAISSTEELRKEFEKEKEEQE